MGGPMKRSMNEAPTPQGPAPVPVAPMQPAPAPAPVAMVQMVECRSCRTAHRRDEACPSCRRRLLEG